ncbi:MAG: hypothetical protein IJ856_01860, partial [Candidatus Methanomethylophilaceae archaeon]|nr:hypothetical protein [Candidatus Methanomethylophilaceae archaeon]
TSNVKTIGTVGSSSINEAGVETILDNKVDLIVATPSNSVKTTCDALMNDDSRGYHIDVVYLWYASSYCIPTIMTMGILMDAEADALAYAQYCYDAEKNITSKISDGDKKDAIVICGFEPTSMASRMSSKGGLDVISGDQAGAYYLMSKIANTYHATDTDNWGYCYRSVEWFIENDKLFDVIIDTESGAGFAKVNDNGTDRFYTQDEYNARFENSIKYFAGTEEYVDGWIVGSTFDFLSGFSGYAMLPVIAAQLYPDQFNMSDAISNLQYWFDNFTTVKLDVTKVGGYRYTGDKFNTAYSTSSSSKNANGFYSWSPTLVRVDGNYSNCTPAFMTIAETVFKAAYGDVPSYDGIKLADIPAKYLYQYSDYTSVDGSGKLVVKTFDNTSDGKSEAYADKTLDFTPNKVICYTDAYIDTIYHILCDYYGETAYGDSPKAVAKLWELIPAMTSSVKSGLESKYKLTVPDSVTIIGTGQEDLASYCGSVGASDKVVVFMSEYNIRSTNKSSWWNTNTAITANNPNVQFVYLLSNSPGMVLSTTEMIGEIIGYDNTEAMMTKILAEIYVMQKAIDDSGKKYTFYVETAAKKAVASNTLMGGIFAYILGLENIVTGDNLMNGELSDEAIISAQPKIIAFYTSDSRSDAECMRVA